MIEVKIRTVDYNKYKEQPYIKDISYSRNWYYPTENELVIIFKTEGYASIMISKNKKEYDSLINELKEDKAYYTRKVQYNKG